MFSALIEFQFTPPGFCGLWNLRQVGKNAADGSESRRTSCNDEPALDGDVTRHGCGTYDYSLLCHSDVSLVETKRWPRAEYGSPDADFLHRKFDTKPLLILDCYEV
jgi:hypothetical protein